MNVSPTADPITDTDAPFFVCAEENDKTTTSDYSSDKQPDEERGKNEKSATASTNDKTPDFSVWQHSLGLAVLCLCSFANSFLFMSASPYLGFMTIDLIPSRLTTENAGIYAGFLTSSLMWGRLLTAYAWGLLADAYGRVRTLQVALLLSAVCSLFFGLAQTYAQAFLWRFGLGMSNAILCLTKIIAYEFSPTDKLERRSMGLVVGMRSWALLISPAIGGFLSEPVRQYPELTAQLLRGRDTWAYRFLQQYPFLLPNLVGAMVCLLAAALLGAVVTETLPVEGPPNPDFSRRYLDITDRLQTLCCARRRRRRGRIDASAAMTCDETKPLVVIGSCDDEDNHNDTGKALSSSSIKNHSIGSSSSASSPPDHEPWVWSRLLTRQHMIVHWMFSFLTTYIDEAFPLFCISTIGGLALTETSIGSILAGAGLLFALFQYATYAWTTSRFGLYLAMIMACLLGTLSVAFIPISVRFRGRPSASAIVTVVMAVTKILHSVYFTSMAVAINRTVPNTHRARLSALLLVGNSIGKGLVAAMGGSYVAFCFSSLLFPARYGSFVIWCFVPLFGLVVAWRLNRLRETMRETVPTAPRAE